MSFWHRFHGRSDYGLFDLICELERRVDRLENRIRVLEGELLPTGISFTEIKMNPTQAGQTQVYSGQLTPARSQFPGDAVFAVTSNDPAIAPTVDVTGFLVTVKYPDGWTEQITPPLEFTYTASSASNPTWSLTATITPPPAPAPLPTSITFTETE